MKVGGIEPIRWESPTKPRLVSAPLVALATAAGVYIYGGDKPESAVEDPQKPPSSSSTKSKAVVGGVLGLACLGAVGTWAYKKWLKKTVAANSTVNNRSASSEEQFTDDGVTGKQGTEQFDEPHENRDDEDQNMSNGASQNVVENIETVPEEHDDGIKLSGELAFHADAILDDLKEFAIEDSYEDVCKDVFFQMFSEYPTWQNEFRKGLKSEIECVIVHVGKYRDENPAAIENAVYHNVCVDLYYKQWYDEMSCIEFAERTKQKLENDLGCRYKIKKPVYEKLKTVPKLKRRDIDACFKYTPIQNYEVVLKTLIMIIIPESMLRGELQRKLDSADILSLLKVLEDENTYEAMRSLS